MPTENHWLLFAGHQMLTTALRFNPNQRTNCGVGAQRKRANVKTDCRAELRFAALRVHDSTDGESTLDCRPSGHPPPSLAVRLLGMCQLISSMCPDWQKYQARYR